VARGSHPFTLEQIDGDPVSLDILIEDGPVVLVFAHSDCPTSTLALRRIAAIQDRVGVRVACVAEETPEGVLWEPSRSSMRLSSRLACWECRRTG